MSAATSEGEIARPWWQTGQVYLAALLFSVTYGAVAWLWYSRFLFGDLPGPYRALSAFSRTPFPVIVILTVVVPAIITFTGLLRANANRPGTGRLLYPLTASLLAGLLTAPAAFPALISPMTHVETVEAGGQTLHLARIDALVDVNFALYTCAGPGLMCEQPFRSQDYPAASTAHLEIDPSSGAVRLIVCPAYRAGDECETAATITPDGAP